jgi:UPF0755 protein
MKKLIIRTKVSPKILLKQLKSALKYKIIFLILLFLVLFMAGGAYYLHYNIFIASKTFESNKLFTVSSGATVHNILVELEDLDIISNSKIAKAYYKFKYNEESIKAGDYVFSGTLTTEDIIYKLVFGETILNEVRVVIPEGYNVFELASLLKEKELVKETSDFVSLSVGLEGYLFPDTYQFKKDASIDDIQQKMLINFKNKTEDLVSISCAEAEIVSDSCNSTKVIILASLLEKEVSTYYDRQVVAGIIENRIEAEMPLQIDATVIYAHILNKYSAGISIATEINKHNPVSLDDLTLDSLYNTYKYRELPPGPISSPGIEAIRAAINLIKTDYWYYLNAKDGTTIFSRTYEEHLANKEKYLR